MFPLSEMGKGKSRRRKDQKNNKSKQPHPTGNVTREQVDLEILSKLSHGPSLSKTITRILGNLVKERSKQERSPPQFIARTHIAASA